MRGLRALTGMALRELWISFRLIPVVALPLAAGIVVIALPPELAGVSAIGGAGFWYAVGASVAICLAGMLAASTMADERRRGTVAWMAVRAVPRSSVLMSWFVAYALLLTSGIAIGAIGAFLAALSRAESPIDPLPFAAAVIAVLTTALAALAAGLLIGAVLGRWVAAIASLALFGVVLAATVAGSLDGVLLPSTGVGLLADLGGSGRPVGDALRAAGAALASGAVLLVLSAALLERADL